jgi:hypothetical protein
MKMKSFIVFYSMQIANNRNERMNPVVGDSAKIKSKRMKGNKLIIILPLASSKQSRVHPSIPLANSLNFSSFYPKNGVIFPHIIIFIHQFIHCSFPGWQCHFGWTVRGLWRKSYGSGQFGILMEFESAICPF